jgi:Spherulation-specific family 4
MVAVIILVILIGAASIAVVSLSYGDSTTTGDTSSPSMSSFISSTNTGTSVNSQNGTIPPIPSSPAQASTGVIVPLFTNVTSQQTAEILELIQIRDAHPTVPMLVVVDEFGGAGTAFNSTLKSQIQDMQNAGISVMGYDATWWATRQPSDVEALMLTWRDWYGVNGIYLDQMPNWNYNGPNYQAYYNGTGGIYIPSYFANLTRYGRSLGFTEIVANSGTDVPSDFIGSVNTIGTFENPYLPSLNLSAGWNSIVGLNGWHTEYNKANFMFFSYNINSLNASYILGVSKYVGYLYITNGTQATDRYGILSPYLNQICTVLASTVNSG